MNLQALTQAHVAPARIQEYLDQHFDRVVIHGCWQYTIHAPSELSEIHLYADDE